MTDDLTRALEVAEQLERRAVRMRHITLAGQLAAAAALLRRLVARCREAEPTPPAESGKRSLVDETALQIKGLEEVIAEAEEENEPTLTMDVTVAWEYVALLRSLRATVERLEGENKTVRGAMRADEERLQRAATAVGAEIHGCDAPEWMADEILALRAEVARLEARDTQWVEFAYAVGQQVNCIYSTWPDGNSHIIEKVARLREDGERMDWLEREANEPDGLLLHDGSHHHRRGLGLRPGSVVRTLRAAIDAARSTPEGDNG